MDIVNIGFFNLWYIPFPIASALSGTEYGHTNSFRCLEFSCTSKPEKSCDGGFPGDSFRSGDSFITSHVIIAAYVHRFLYYIWTFLVTIYKHSP